MKKLVSLNFYNMLGRFVVTKKKFGIVCLSYSYLSILLRLQQFNLIFFPLICFIMFAII